MLKQKFLNFFEVLALLVRGLVFLDHLDAVIRCELKLANLVRAADLQILHNKLVLDRLVDPILEAVVANSHRTVALKNEVLFIFVVPCIADRTFTCVYHILLFY